MTKAQRTATLRAMARLVAQCALNAGDSQVHGRRTEQAGWEKCMGFLRFGASLLSDGRALPAAEKLPGLEDF